MGYIFEPDAMIANILHVLSSLQDRWNDADVQQRPMWESAIEAQLANLDAAIKNMVAQIGAKDAI